MKKKNLLTAAASLALVAVVAVGATLAYFTDQTETAENVFTSGKVSLQLVDESPALTGVADAVLGTQTAGGAGLSYKVLPGDTVSKTVGATVDADSEQCWVAIRVQLADVALPHAAAPVTVASATQQLYTLVQNAIDTKDWDIVAGADGALTCYYKTPCDANAAPVLFTRFTVDPAWGNAYADMSFDINVQAAAVQTAHRTLAEFKTMDFAAIPALA